MAAPHVLAIVLAGGEGKRLMPLTADRAKPAVPFGGLYRLVDFALSNLVNSRYLQIIVLTQYKSHSLDRHVARTWRMSPLLGNYVAPVPAQQRVGKHWYLGSADAIYQCLNIIPAEDPTRIAEFLEKPTSPKGLPDSPGEILASMGNYVANADALIEAVTKDSENPTSKHDMGGDIVPYFVQKGTAGVYDFIHNDVEGSTDRDRDYWRDVGTLDSYYDAHIDLISINPVFNLYNTDWPLFSGYAGLPPAKFVHASPGRLGHAADSLVSPGVIVSGATVSGSVLSPGVYLHSWSSVSDSVILDDVAVGRHAQVHRAILDKNVVMEERARVGIDPEHDRARGFTVTDSGITVVPKGTVVTA